MKGKWKYKISWKALWIVICHLSLIVFAASAIFLLLWTQQGYEWKDKKNTSYTKTNGFANMMKDELYSITDVMLSSQYLQEAEEIETPILDIMKLYKTGIVSFDGKSDFGYKFDDLKKWTEQGWRESWDDPSTNIVVCQKENGEKHYFYYKDFIEKIKKKELLFSEINGYEEEILNEVYDQNFYNVQTMKEKNSGNIYRNFEIYINYQIAEKYAPEGADSILEIANEHPDGILEEYFNALNNALDQVSSMENNLADLEKYTQGNTNISYVYVNLSARQVASNIPNIRYTNYEKEIEKWEDKEAYIHLESKLENCSTNTKINLEETREIVERIAQNENDFVFVMAVNPDFPIADKIANKAIIYETYVIWVQRAIAGVVLGLVLFMLSIIFLTIGAGKNCNDSEIHLHFFDSVWTEIAAIMITGIWIFISMILLQCFDRSIEDIWKSLDSILASAAILALETTAFFLIGYLSLVRRIKAGTMWKNSFTRRCLLWISKIWKKGCKITNFILKNTQTRIKTVAAIVGFCFLQFLLTVMAIGAGSGFFILVLAVLDLAVLIYCLKIAVGREVILEGLKRISGGELQYKIPVETLKGEQQTEAEYINRIGEGLDHAVEDSLRNERMKTELITNVSHDIKTPLTSIINYVDLLKRENLADPKVQEYIQILDEKSNRLKILTEDIVEASKASTGSIKLEMTDLNLTEMLAQISGEFEEKLAEKNLNLICNVPKEPVILYADGRRMWRVFENIFGNVCKYAMNNTRVYADIKIAGKEIVFSLKNISANELNISANELTERFIRGDVARNTEGSGLGLSIAKSLTELQGGTFQLYLDGDLFKVEIRFPSKL